MRRVGVVRPGLVPDDPRDGPRQVRAHHRRPASRYSFPNREEGEALTGERDPAAVTQNLHERYNGAVVVLKLDKDGCFVRAKDHAQHYPTGDVAVLDATGAGDAFDAAFLARYLRDGDLAEAAQFANTIGEWVVAHWRAPADRRRADELLAQ
ncbi:MAG: PfkB family carbohydrate kinase [Kouleothrix sp.]